MYNGCIGEGGVIMNFCELVYLEFFGVYWLDWIWE